MPNFDVPTFEQHLERLEEEQECSDRREMRDFIEAHPYPSYDAADRIILESPHGVPISAEYTHTTHRALAAIYANPHDCEQNRQLGAQIIAQGQGKHALQMAYYALNRICRHFQMQCQSEITERVAHSYVNLNKMVQMDWHRLTDSYGEEWLY